MKRRALGFTLIEVMMVVAIIGILSSVAIPAFQELYFKAKQAERDIALKTMEEDIKVYQGEHDAWPSPFGGNFFITGWNPAFPPAGTKRPWRNNDPAWSRMDFKPSADVYHSYLAFGISGGAFDFFYVYSAGDLDSDGAVAVRYRGWMKQGGQWTLFQDVKPSGVY